MLDDRVVFGGMDTHPGYSCGAVVDVTGRLLDSAAFDTDIAGCERLGYWLGSHRNVARVGVEGTGGYGARQVIAWFSGANGRTDRRAFYGG